MQTMTRRCEVRLMLDGDAARDAWLLDSSCMFGLNFPGPKTTRLTLISSRQSLYSKPLIPPQRLLAFDAFHPSFTTRVSECLKLHSTRDSRASDMTEHHLITTESDCLRCATWLDQFSTSVTLSSHEVLFVRTQLS